MNKIIKIFSVFALFFIISSCNNDREILAYDGDPAAFFIEKSAVLKGPDVGSKEYNVQIGTLTPLTSAATVTVTKLSGNAVEGTDYVIENGGTVTIPAGSTVGILKVKVFGAALSQTTAKTLVFGLSSSSIPLAQFNKTISLSLLFGCDSNLQGAYTYSTTNGFTPENGGIYTAGPVTGAGTLNVVGDGVYSITDASFGIYVDYGPGTIATGVKLRDSCGKLSFEGPNQYGDNFTISNVAVNGNKLTFNWITTYLEYGTTVLTRTDGQNWPTNLN